MPLHRFLAPLRQNPLVALTLIAVVPRILAAFFSGGYYAHDDHFLMIEAAGSWVDGADYNRWLPWNQPQPPIPTGHMMVYPGLHFLLFTLLKAIGISTPGPQMVVVRLLHAAWSLLVVRVGYRLALRASGPETAWRCGLFLALFFFMPFLSVRNLIEMVSAPLLMLAAWHAWQGVEQDRWRSVALAGLFAGLALNIRFQTLFFVGGMGLAFLLLRHWRSAVVFGIAALVPLVVLQGAIDLVIWGRPFVELAEYVGYNADNVTTYFDLPWYNYLLLLAGIFIPPLSLAVLFGFVRRPKPLVIWLPVLCFIAAHSVFPNKQERFILPIVPLFFVLGYTSWEAFRSTSGWWRARTGLWRGILRWTWGLNLLLLVPLTFSYSKRERVEAMLLLRDAPEVTGIITEDVVERDTPMPPLYYWGAWQAQNLSYTDSLQDLAPTLNAFPEAHRANAVLFLGEEDLDRRRARMERFLGPMTLVGRAEPGLLDRTMHWLNPVNRNTVITIYRANKGLAPATTPQPPDR
ncbi:MAG TPA: glycosyltransferase family 39 protein [Flavobacteriales bacterium]